MHDNLTTLAPDPVATPAVAATEANPLRHALVALDASDHANRGLQEAVRLVGSTGLVTGIHVYAAALHDRRFRQMEGGLPERYRKEGEIERQREVHDSLISRGLGIISDSYHDAAARVCAEAGIRFERASPEGKNYRRLAEACAGGAHDFLALGALGLGAVPGAAIGSVCARVARRCAIDLLAIREPRRAVGDGPLVVGLDGSARAFGALLTAFEIGRRTGAPVHAVAAYDPAFHYVAFHRIAGVLSDEAGKVFRFREQEKLHEEIIDDGLAKIYRSHLDVARHIAAERSLGIETQLLEGKPFRAVADYAGRVGASLLLLGKTGIHADAELDIGGNAEVLLRSAPCHIWLSVRAYTPPLDAVARETMRWTDEAEAKLARVPQMVRDMVRMAVARFALERGHTVITTELVDGATRSLCPHAGDGEAAVTPLSWSAEAEALIAGLADPSLAAQVRLRAEKNARRAMDEAVRPEHVRPLLGTAAPSLHWQAEALARLAQVPEMARERVRERIAAAAAEAGAAEVSLAMAEAAIEESRRAMRQRMAADGHGHQGAH